LRVAADDHQFAAVRDRLDELMVQIAGASEPYWIANEVGGLLLDAMTESVAATSVYLIWASLTDRYELKPKERTEAEGEMRQAASEWLVVKDDAAARDRYLDHWRFDVCGYAR
jgi:hypothetical protein